MLRLQKYLAECGVASRRKAEELIAAGRVRVNGIVVSKLGSKVDPAKDKVAVDGRPAHPETEKIYLKMYKPRGYASSCVSQKGERTVLDLVQAVKERLYPVGRLDMSSEGLIILTNDGELANKLMHPRYEHEKEYEVGTYREVTGAMLEALKSGVMLDDEKTLPARVVLTGEKSFTIVLKEGKNRQIRRMVEAVSNKVVSLKRIRVNNITLGDLRPGQCSPLTRAEITRLLG
jgi:23S rRNA pseudouridine2605 synthase